MSSFDRFDVLLLKNELGSERCLWREGSSVEIHDCDLDSFEMESIADEFCKQLEQAFQEVR